MERTEKIEVPICDDGAGGFTVKIAKGMRMAQVLRGETVRTYVYSPDSPYRPMARVDQPLVTAEDGMRAGTQKTIWHHHAHDNGQVYSVTDDQGDVVWEPRFTGFGAYKGSEWNSDKAFDEPLRYAGQYADEETGLHYNTFRYYDPASGRFVCEDPIGLGGGLNLYQYAPNPISWIDPWGLSPDTDVTTFFHAGNIEGPIDPSMGRMGLDFNPAGQGGFYVTTDANQAAEWAARRGTSVTQFNVPNTELEALNIKSFPSANSEWGEFVTQGRAGTLAHTFDAVEGPMLRNVHQVMSSGARPLARGSQFAIFTKKAAAVFDRFKVGGGCG